MPFLWGYLITFAAEKTFTSMAEQTLLIYNSLTRRKERFEPLHAPGVGMYVCGPTVYGDAHLGHARPAITFDIVFRYLRHLGYKVRYVRNITDVGHLEYDSDDGEDKIARKARLEQAEPMEIADYYTRRFNDAMNRLGVLPPSIEPHASGHIIEQQELVKQILDAGYAYVSNGSVYFDIEAYNRKYKYGILSGRSLENTKDASRDLAGVGEKRNQADFALWKKAQAGHIMRWPSPWGEGFPGWHCECTAMGRKYLGETFDIHGGGMDLLFPHHECEIAQAQAAMGHQAVRYWMHNNMITINGKKMGKSYNNFITLEEFFTGSHPLLEKAYSPMTIRFFILSAHYRGTLDFSNEALGAAEKGLARLMQGLKALRRIQPSKGSSPEVGGFVREMPGKFYDAMNDDFQTPVAVSLLFEACRTINLIEDRKAKISAPDLETLEKTVNTFARDILGLSEDGEERNGEREKAYGKAVDMLMEIRQKAKENRDWATSDDIRRRLTEAGFVVKDTPEGSRWEL